MTQAQGVRAYKAKSCGLLPDRRAAEHCTVESNAYPYGTLTIDGSR
jgi:hypothetical protein